MCCRKPFWPCQYGYYMNLELCYRVLPGKPSMIKKASNKLALLTAAMSDGEFHDGTALGKTLQMTRSAVWKMIKKLERYDIEINSVKGRGYALCEPVTLLDETLIKKNLANKKCQLAILESVTSTNAYLKTMRHPKGVSFCLAEQQTAGKGRMNRGWHSPFGKNIYLSCLYPFQKDMSELAGLSLVVSLAIVQALKKLGLQQGIHVKWPNDIVCEDQKISGTLIEVQAESHGVCHAVIGIGLNVNMMIDERRRILQSWTSLRRVLGKYLDRNEVAALLMNVLLEYLRRFDRDGFEEVISEWMSTEIMTGKEITVKSINGTSTGIAVGVNAQGHLLLKMNDGQTRTFSSGDTTIIKK